MAGDLAVEAAFAQGNPRAQVPPGADRSVCISMRQLHLRSRGQRKKFRVTNRYPALRCRSQTASTCCLASASKAWPLLRP